MGEGECSRGQWLSSTWLSHVGVHAAPQVGLWGTLITWYPADCDYYSRVRTKGYTIVDFDARDIFDAASCLSNLEIQLFQPRGSPADHNSFVNLQEIARSKIENKGGRNTWKGRNRDGLVSEYFWNSR